MPFTGSRRQLLGLGWWKSAVPVRALDDFSLTPANRSFLEGVACSAVAVDTVSDFVDGVPSAADFRFAVRGPYILGVCAYFGLSIGGYLALSALVPTHLAFLGFVFLALPLAVGILLISIIRENRVNMLTHRNEALVINRLLRVLEVSELTKNDPNSESLRQLMREIHRSADLFYRAFGWGWGGRRGDRKLRNSTARACTAALRSYAPTALKGGRADLQGISEDFARAILRVGSQNWAEVADLNPAVSTKRRFISFLPSLHLSQGLVAAVIPLIVAVLGVLAPGKL